jgi:hypothetical protein
MWRDCVLVEADWTVGATGAVGTVQKDSCVSAVTRVSAGLYKIALADSWYRLLGVIADIEFTGALAVGIGTHNEDVASATAPLVQVVCRSLDTAFGDTDPPSGSKIRVVLILKNSKSDVPGA